VRALLFVGAILVELFLAVMLLGGVVYGITQTYSIGAAGYNRFGLIGAVLSLVFLWVVAWLPALINLGLMCQLPTVWRSPDETRPKKIGTTAGMVVAMLLMSCMVQYFFWLPLWIIGLDDCSARLVDVLAWRWPCR
jgi:hypothetical protein